MEPTPVYYLFFKLMYFIITRCLLAGVAGAVREGGGNMINNWYAVWKSWFAASPLVHLSLAVVRTHLLWWQIWRRVTTASHLITNLVRGERQGPLLTEALFVQGAQEKWLPGSEVSYSLVSREMRRGLTFLSCVSKQRDLFERHLDYRVKSCSLNLSSLGHGRHATSKQSLEMRSESNYKTSLPPVSLLGDEGVVLLFTEFGSCCVVEHRKSI